ncbi:type II toxin-antitoxin system RelE/ParE family toxin [Salmonella enterica subsp. enterica serovar Agona]|uniref:Plasmid stabilization protein ParE n=1 Tax=Enterobacter hormaechei subsp. xiangfangensis TaxID=1296536 RepID=A0A837F6R9_9ENTR|nr:type II toxin-antitoxin system RelE/ParE family toxin [Enterobacter sp. CRENT-193]ECD0745248.1 type II toxin-antitoxin system RelE/ParE family toxin [Salmonella enterica subsp. enterica serovar Agona]ECE2008657.1 type II toxin-antitoxin system RelE/ParE family toxin [Salmonella enterica]EIW8643609.1 type II toxin-antitoxin system RelE/ParE family toxin [Klebsiella pneumoniae]KJM63995.1 plasmid stabilization protein ParE [Enterobacter hormaechei subsp. oharae]RAZ15251.1 type II toxin-antitox
MFDVQVIQEIETEHGEDISSLPLEQYRICFVSSHSVVTMIRLLGQSQDTATHDPWR